MAPLPAPNTAHFTEFASSLIEPTLLSRMELLTAVPVAFLRQRLQTAVAEAQQTLRILSGLDLPDGARLLEVGAGMGVCSAYLSRCGYTVVAIEPGGVGFDENRRISEALRELSGASHQLESVGAEDLTRERHGEFSLCFSNNVLEHVDSPLDALGAMSKVLAPSGVMVHSCPNYSIPYEPHFGIPLVPFRPRATRFLLPESIRASQLWESLNFVRAKDITAIAATFGLGVGFRSGLLARSIRRLRIDDEFRARHQLIGSLAAVAERLRLVKLLARLPPSLSTPMDMLLFRSGGLTPAQIARWEAS